MTNETAPRLIVHIEAKGLRDYSRPTVPINRHVYMAVIKDENDMQRQVAACWHDHKTSEAAERCGKKLVKQLHNLLRDCGVIPDNAGELIYRKWRPLKS